MRDLQPLRAAPEPSPPQLTRASAAPLSFVGADTVKARRRRNAATHPSVITTKLGIRLKEPVFHAVVVAWAAISSRAARGRGRWAKAGARMARASRRKIR